MNDISDLKPNIVIGDNYQGLLSLDSWKDFQSRQFFSGLKETNPISDGVVKVRVEGKQVDDVKTTTLAQVNAIQFLINHSDKIRAALLTGLLDELSNLKEVYDNLTPDISGIEDIKKVIGLSYLHVMSSDKDDFAYVGFELDCEWNEEHGIGVIMHKDRIVKIGQAEITHDSWATYVDNGTIELETAKWNEATAKLQETNQIAKKKTMCWKFW
jgi:hypothetical protein